MKKFIKRGWYRGHSRPLFMGFFYILGICFAYEKKRIGIEKYQKFKFYLTIIHLFDIFLLTVNEKGGVIAFICIKVISFISKIKKRQKIFYPSNN